MTEQPLFENSQLRIQDLPSSREITFSPLQKTYLYILWIYRSIFFGILFIASLIIAFFVDLPFSGWLLPVGVLALYMVSLIVTRIAFRYKGYAVRQRDIVYKTGWLNTRLTTVPFNRVQHVDISQSIFERSFEISTLNVYTAGGQASDLSVPGLIPDAANSLKTFILQTVDSDEEE